MPYEGEFAQHQSIRRLTQSEKVKQLLGGYRVSELTSSADHLNELTQVDLDSTGWLPEWVMAVDGSYLPITIENGFPGAEAAYVTVASVLINVAKIRELDKSRPVNPLEFRKSQEAESIDSALPGCNVITAGQPSAVCSMRKALFSTFEDKRVFTECESLLETYEALLEYKPRDNKEECCPFGEDCMDSHKQFVRGKGHYVCSCDYHRELYSTDALRIQEGMNPAGSNGAMYQEIMQVWERIWIVHFLRALEAKGWLSSLRRMAIVLDGPLAIFGHPAWLSQAIYKELCRLNQKIRQATSGQDLLLIGIEKTGAFAQHFNMLDMNLNGSGDKLRSPFTALLSDNYIKKYIVFNDSDRLYGRQAYFGRKLFHKTPSGALVTANLPFLEEDHRATTRTEISQYPRLQDAIAVLNELVSSRYQNAVTPLVQAHAEAAIPLNLGKQVLENLARSDLPPVF